MQHFLDGVLMRPLLALSSAILFLCMPGATAQQDEPGLLRVRAEGITDGVGFTARHGAIEDAQREAVQMVLHARVASGKLDDLAPMLRRATGYVTRYDVLRHDTLGDQTRVELDVLINERKLNYDLAAIMLPRLKEPPEVLLVIGERIGRDTLVAIPDFGAAEVVITEAIEKLGVKAVSATTLAQTFTHPQLAALVEGDLEAAAAFSRQQEQSVIVIGTAITESTPGPEGANLLRNRAVIELRVLRNSDGKMMESVGATAVVNGVDPDIAGDLAVRDAAAKLASDLTVAAVITSLSMSEQERIHITVHNAPSQTVADALLSHLQAHPETLSADLRLFNPAESRIRLVFFGPLAELVAYLESRSYDGHEIRIRRAVDREITLSF